MDRTEKDRLQLAYLAGAMDSDGYFTIKKSTYHMRVRGDATQPVYIERIGLKQVTPDIPARLRGRFGGSVLRERGQSANSKPLWSWQCTNMQAAKACAALLPFLIIKRHQCEIILELRKSKVGSDYGKFAYWFEKEHPDWRDMEMLTSGEASSIIGYVSPVMLSQATRNGSLLVLPYDHRGVTQPRYPKPLILAYALHAKKARDGRGRVRPLQLMAWREKLFGEIRELNKIGVSGTPVYRREGPYKPK